MRRSVPVPLPLLALGLVAGAATGCTGAAPRSSAATPTSTGSLTASVTAPATASGTGTPTPASASPTDRRASQPVPRHSTATRSAAAPSRAASAPAAAGSPSGSTVAGGCAPAQLRLGKGAFDAASSQWRQVVTFTNTSSSECSLDGHPGIQFSGGDGSVVPVTPTYGGSYTFPAVGPRRVILRPGSTASFSLGGVALGSGGRACPETSRLKVIPPDDYLQLSLRVAVPVCAGAKVAVSPVVAGSAGVGY